MKILETNSLYEAAKNGKVWLTLWGRLFEHNGIKRLYFFVSRGATCSTPETKLPDAVVIAATHLGEDGVKRLVVTKEFRPAIGGKEIGFPAGLIDKGDYPADGNLVEAACRAAIREFREETGLDFKPIEVSPPNLYSSGGLTDESSTMVIGEATGTISADGQESSEDIEVLLLDQDEVQELINVTADGRAHSKSAWPFMRNFVKTGYL